ncbi:MAG: tail fiber domain-containing protein [Methanolobus sp.]|nr:tail fiber domain-containing protein [Methanolobus sp.]
MRYFQTVVLVLIFSFNTYAQIKVTNGGKVGIGTNNPSTKLDVLGEVNINSYIGAWGRAISTDVHYQNSCAYNLWNWYYNRDVFFVCGDGYLWTLKGGYFGSDIKFKKDVHKIESALNTIRRLQGVKYIYDDSKIRKPQKGKNPLDTTSTVPNEVRFGLIAQDVEKIIPEVVKTMPDSSKAISYTDIIAVLIEAMKEQQIQIEALQSIIVSQEKDITALKSNNTKAGTNLKSAVIIDSTSITTTVNKTDYLTNATLFQNSPNPFNSDTEIKFILPSNFKSAMLNIYNLQGNELYSYKLVKSQNVLKINSSQLQAGMFLYSLIIDNNVIDTKRMLLTKE